MDLSFLAKALTSLLALIISLSFHEAAHAYTAKLQGDDTAEREGRMTLNPFPHIDPIGTLFLPFFAIISQIPFLFGWAKPVPVDPRRFKNGKWSEVMVAGAGPAANLVLSALCLLALGLYERTGTQLIPEGSFFYPLLQLLGSMVIINAVLAFFNLIPLPPLDGGTVIKAFLPDDVGEAYERNVAPYGTWILLGLLMFGGFHWIGKVAMVYVNSVNTATGFLLNVI